MAENEINKFTILGETGSGKTCYLLGMYYEMTMGVAGYTLTTQNPDDDKNLTVRYEMLNDKKRGQGRFPDPSDSMQKYNFDLNYAYEKILPFEWIDYPGHFLDPKYGDKSNAQYKEQYEAVEKNIKESDMLYICIDGANLTGSSTTRKIRNVKSKCGRNISPYLAEFNGKLPPIAMIVTKFDMCEADTDAGEVKEIIEEAFEGLFQRDDVFIAIVPVSLGATLQDDSYSGDLDPLNIHLPILMGINFSLIDQLCYAKKVIERDKEYVNQTEKLKRNEEDRWAISRWLFGGYDIDSLQKDISDTKEIIEHNKKVAQYFKKSLYRVNRDLAEIDMIFANGNWQDKRTIHKMWDDLQSVANYF